MNLPLFVEFCVDLYFGMLYFVTRKRDRAGCFALIVFLMSCFCCRSVNLPHDGAVGWSAVCDCGISWSYSLTFLSASSRFCQKSLRVCVGSSKTSLLSNAISTNIWCVSPYILASIADDTRRCIVIMIYIYTSAFLDKQPVWLTRHMAIDIFEYRTIRFYL